jgi:alpha-beta hydrolase superfamily lysophospholipase
VQRSIRRRDFAALLGMSLAAGALPGCGDRTNVAPRPQAAPSFGAAVHAIHAAIARDAADHAILPAALPRLYEHGTPVRRAVVLFHGFTNCPQQFDALARALHTRGCNVYVPRIPRHGLKDRLTRDLANLTLAELEGCANDAYELARGLGATVATIGLSLGGSMVLWLAQTRPVDLAVPIAPFLMPVAPVGNHAAIPSPVGDPAMRVLYTLPSMYWWWDPAIKEGTRPVYAYPGYPTHALAELVFLADAIFADAASAKPRARRCVLVLNEHDNAVDNGVARKLLALWNGRGVAYRELVLTGLGGPRHDIIDPTTFPQGRTLVYPKLEDLVLH